MGKKQQAQIITPEELETLKRPLPASWTKAFGLLKGRRLPDPVAWQRKIRAEWDRRTSKPKKRAR